MTLILMTLTLMTLTLTLTLALALARHAHLLRALAGEEHRHVALRLGRVGPRLGWGSGWG